MYVREVASASFVLLRADLPAGSARQALRKLLATHLVIAGLGEPVERDVYGLLSSDEAVQRLSAAAAETPLQQALGLRAHDAVPLVDADAAVEDLPDRCVVREQGRVIGFFDATATPARRAFVTRGGAGHPARGKLGGRSLVAEFPGKVDRGTVAWLLIGLSASAGAGMPVPALPTGAQIDILVQPRFGFVVQGNDRLTLTVSADEETLPVQFKLLAVNLGPGQVNVLAFHQGQPLGKIVITATVQEADAQSLSDASGGIRRQDQPLADITVKVPDLMMLIDERRSGDGIEYVIRLTAAAHGLNLKAFGPIRLRTDPMAFFADFFAEIEALPLDTSQEQAVAVRKLAARGADLFSRVFPEELQQTLWSLRHSIDSIIVQSEEPWIPWELCKLCGQENGRVTEGPFLCQAYSMTRWIPGLSFKGPLTLRNLALVVPEDSSLPLAPSERDYILSLAQNGRQVSRIPATYVDVQSALASGSYDGWHFTGHGAARNGNPDRAVMFLDNNEPFSPEDVSGVVTNLGRSRPLVFLNACQIGRAGMSLTDIGGWAKRFVDAGAGAFIGAYWNVYDQAAFDFARALYDGLLGGVPVGRAVKEARAAVKPSGDPTWLAYTVFADPLAQVGR
jgi:hypothetical protein